MTSSQPTDRVRALPSPRRGWAWHLVLLALAAAVFAATWAAEPPDLSGVRAYLTAVGAALGAAE